MNKSNASALVFLQKSSESSNSEKTFIESFEEVKPSSMSGFRGMFGDFKLNNKEKIKIQLRKPG